MATSQITPIQCPVCGAQFSAPIESVIDVGRDPQLKAQFLQGNINVAQCPQCGTQAPMTAPLLYHDPANELALVLMPNELNLHHDDQQKIIGGLTSAATIWAVAAIGMAAGTGFFVIAALSTLLVLLVLLTIGYWEKSKGVH